MAGRNGSKQFGDSLKNWSSSNYGANVDMAFEESAYDGIDRAIQNASFAQWNSNQSGSSDLSPDVVYQ